jgi:hypothetical protein
MSLPSSRTGSPPILFSTILARSAGADRKAFAEHAGKELARKIAEVSRSEAEDAFRAVQARPRSYAAYAALGAASSPTLKALGRGVEAAVDGRDVLSHMKATPGKNLASALEGAVAGGVVRAVADGLERRKAKKTVQAFVEAHPRAKLSAMAPPAPAVSALSSGAARSVSKFPGTMSANALKPPGSALSGVVDPRRSIKASILPA